MEKKALVEKLQKDGYKVALEGNVPMFDLSEAMSVEKIKELLEKYDYTASFGYRMNGRQTTAATSKKRETVEKKTKEIPKSESDMDFVIGTNGQYSLF